MSPAAQRHLTTTIFKPVPLDLVRRAGSLPLHEFARLERIQHERGLHLWGVMPGERNQNLRRWEKMILGDVVVFKMKKDAVALATVLFKLRNDELAELLWGSSQTANGERQTWECVFAVSRPEQKPFNREVFNEVIGRDPRARIQEFNLLTQPQSDEVLNYFDLRNRNIGSYSRPTTVPPTRRPGTTQRREPDEKTEISAQGHGGEVVPSEEQILRDQVLPEGTGTCALCQRSFPTPFLSVTWIKKSTDCSMDEKTDLDNVVMPTCTFGCENLFKLGHVGVDDDGNIVVSTDTPESGPVHEYVEQWLQGSHCQYWEEHEGSQDYFAHHFTRVKKNHTQD